MNLKEAKVIITGGSSGIGRATAKLLKDAGAEVVIAARNEEKLKKAAEDLGCFYYVADVSEEQKCLELFNFAITKMGEVNVLINNAGFGTFAPIHETKTEDFEAMWKVNTKGLFLMGREAAKHFIAKEYGNIINIGSTAAARGFRTGSAYVASKFAVSGLTECWRAELRPHNIRVSQVNPSEVVTNFFGSERYNNQSIDSKLKPTEIAHTIKSMLEMNDVGFIPTAEVWATNPK